MAAVVRRAASRSVLAAARSAVRGWHSSVGLEAQAIDAAPRRAAGRAASEFAAPSGSPGSFVQGARSSLPRIACAQSLLPLHSAMAAARLVSRLGASSFSEQAVLDANRGEQRRNMSSGGQPGPCNDGAKETISVTFVNKDGEEQTVKVPVGTSMLEAAHANDIELEGACEGSLACSTCHVILMDEEYYNKLPEPSDEENDMLDLAFGLTETSRLGCQVIAKPELNGMRLVLPAATRNFAVDGHVPKPH